MDALIYLDDYIDAIDALPLELQRSFTLLKELDGYAHELTNTTARRAMELIDHIKDMPPDRRLEKCKHMAALLVETLKREEEKVVLAQTAFDRVDRLCHRLDADIVRFQQETTRPYHVTTEPWLAPWNQATSAPANHNPNPITKRRSITAKTQRPESVKKRKTTKNHDGLRHPDKEKRTGAGPGRRSKTHAPIDRELSPSEPVYCFCRQVSAGEMLGCDSGYCDIEWFHLECLGLKTAPQGDYWYCDECVAKMKGTKKRPA